MWRFFLLKIHERYSQHRVVWWRWQALDLCQCLSGVLKRRCTKGMILEKKFTFPGKKIHVPWKKYLQPLEKKFRLLWPYGPLVLWSSGPLVLWSSGPLVLWSCGPGPLVLWSSGPLVLWFWSCGHVVPWQRHEKKYVRTKKAWKECKRKWRKRRSGTINKYSFNNN